MALSDSDAYRVFVSYTHKDNGSDDRIVQLARDIIDEYELLTGSEIRLFLDIDEIQWGDKLLPSIEAAISEISFFVPVITPRYFKSEACRKELTDFSRTAQSLRLEGLILPVLYADVLELHDPEVDADPLIELVKERKWFDWRELRLTDRLTAEYRRGISQMAERLRSASLAAQEVNLVMPSDVPPGDGVEDDDEDQSPLGLLDRMAEAETTMPALTQTLDEMASEIAVIGEVTEKWSERVQFAPTLRSRLQTVKKFAAELQPHSDRVLMLGGKFADQLGAVDIGVTAMIEQGAAAFDKADPGTRAGICEFFRSIESLAVSAGEGFESIEGMADSVKQVEGLSKDIRPPMRALSKGLMMAVDGASTIENWAVLIRATNTDCSSFPTAGDELPDGDAPAAGDSE